MMRQEYIRIATIAVALTLGVPAMAGCAFTPERNDPEMSSSTENTQEPEIAAAVEASSENITSARVEHVRSGLGVNLYVTFHVSSDMVTAAELEGVLDAVAPLVPEGMGVVRITARDEGVTRIPLTEAAEELELPELSIKSEGVVVLSPDALASRYAK
jgi:hypothetical protein